jgi:protein associated with RNAse G/E
MSDKSLIKINSRKFDGKIHRSWKAELIEETSDLYVFVGVFDFEVKHSKLGVIRRNTISHEYYWKNKWFNIFRFHEPDGNLRNFYCNINQPPELKNRVLDYIDLDIDVLVWRDFSLEILDLDEFEENIIKYQYSTELQRKVHSSLAEILNLVKKRKFPFDYQKLET